MEYLICCFDSDGTLYDSIESTITNNPNLLLPYLRTDLETKLIRKTVYDSQVRFQCVKEPRGSYKTVSEPSYFTPVKDLFQVYDYVE